MALEKQKNFISLQELNKLENVLEENVILSTEINSSLPQSSLPLPLPPPLFSSLPITLSTPSSVLIPVRQPLPLSVPLPPSLPLSLPQSLPHSILKTSFLVENGKKCSFDSSSEFPNYCCQKCGISLLLSFLSETGSSMTYIEIKNEIGNDENIVWCSSCNKKFHIKCTGITYSPYVPCNENKSNYHCEICLNQKASLPQFSTHLGPSIEALEVISQVMRSDFDFNLEFLFCSKFLFQFIFYFQFLSGIIFPFFDLPVLRVFYFF